MTPSASYCKGCSALIYWKRTAAGRMQPFDPDGTAHHITCPEAHRFHVSKQKLRARGDGQQNLFPGGEPKQANT